MARAIASATLSGDCLGPCARVANPDLRVITSKNSVSVEIGYTTDTWSPVPSSSARRHSARPTCANFVAEYGPMNGMPRLPTIDETMIVWPRPCCPEHRQRGARRVERAEEVHVHDRLHLSRADAVDLAVDAVARIAHHHVEAPELAERRLDEGVHVRRSA